MALKLNLESHNPFLSCIKWIDDVDLAKDELTVLRRVTLLLLKFNSKILGEF
jgi:hypothetical protein